MKAILLRNGIPVAVLVNPITHNRMVKKLLEGRTASKIQAVMEIPMVIDMKFLSSRDLLLSMMDPKNVCPSTPRMEMTVMMVPVCPSVNPH